MNCNKEGTGSPTDCAPAITKPRAELLALAEHCGAVLTGKTDGSEAITVVFTISAWRAFDAALLKTPNGEVTGAKQA